MPRNPRVKAGKAPNNTHDITLSDCRDIFGAMFDGGPRGIQEVPQQASTLLFNSGQGKYGDYSHGLSHIEKPDWTGGRGRLLWAGRV